MTSSSTDIASLLGSRICHDLISPIGAISNGVELLRMSGEMSGPELELISESVENANARIRFFRVAFGAGSPDHMMSAGDVRAILADLSRGTRLSIEWTIDRDMPRDQVKLAFLLIQCLEVALPRGGAIKIRNEAVNWIGIAEADRINFAQELWTGLTEPSSVAAEIKPSEIQFLILSLLLADAGRSAAVEHRDTEIHVRF